MLIEVRRNRSTDVLRSVFFLSFIIILHGLILVVLTGIYKFSKYLSKQMVALATPLKALTN
jgi:hypothetical protein